MKNNIDIDFVVTWVDGNDENWQKEKEKYCTSNSKDVQKIDTRNVRYRDLGLLKYWFRSVEKFAPWVHKIYFVTWGHVPTWLDTKNEKIVIVKHEDYMNKKYLPTFNSNAIEASMHRIKGLSEHFVYFNDDMYLLKPTKPTDFFKKGLPCDTLCLWPVLAMQSDGFYKKINNNLEIINRNFKFNSFVKTNFFKLISPKQGIYLLNTIPLLRYKGFVGFKNFHVPIPYLKSTFERVWSKESDILEKTMSFKFRNNTESVNHWLFQYWQFASGNFVQRKSSFSKFLTTDSKNLHDIIKKQKYSMIVINERYEDIDFEKTKKEITESFEQILSEKSTFEK